MNELDPAPRYDAVYTEGMRLAMAESSETLRATQKMRGRPVTYAEAVKAAERLIARAHNGPGEKSTMSIPVQPTDDDVLLTDYLTEQARLASRYAEALRDINDLDMSGTVAYAVDIAARALSIPDTTEETA